MTIGDIFEGKITTILKYGCFVSFNENNSGMVHISEVSSDFISDINEIYKLGDTVMVKIIKIDENNRINLSIKRAMPRKERPQKQDFHYTPKKKPQNQEDLNFEDKLKMFMTNSQERLTDVKHSNEKKTGGRRRR